MGASSTARLNRADTRPAPARDYGKDARAANRIELNTALSRNRGKPFARLLHYAQTLNWSNIPDWNLRRLVRDWSLKPRNWWDVGNDDIVLGPGHRKKDWFAPTVTERKEGDLMWWLDRNPMGLTLTAIARELGVTDKTANKRLNSAIAEGWAVRFKAPSTGGRPLWVYQLVQPKMGSGPTMLPEPPQGLFGKNPIGHSRKGTVLTEPQAQYQVSKGELVAPVAVTGVLRIPSGARASIEILTDTINTGWHRWTFSNKGGTD